MATLLHRTLDNFVYQMEQIDPTSTLSHNRFTNIDPTYSTQVDNSASRLFYIEWTDSDGEIDAGTTDSDRREAFHNYLIHIFYPVSGNYSDMHNLILQDRHDIVKRIRRKEFAAGVSGDATLDTGIYHRSRVGDELRKENDVWELVIKFRCKIMESEQ